MSRKKKHKSQAPDLSMKIEHVNLERFERYAYGRSFELGALELIRTLRQYRRGALFLGHAAREDVQERLFDRAAAAIGALFSDPGFDLNEEGFGRLSIDHATLDAIFEVSAFGTADYVAAQVQLDQENRDLSKAQFSSHSQLAKFLLFWSTRSAHGVRFEELSKAPDLTLPLWLGLLAYATATHDVAHERREALVDYASAYAEADLPGYALGTLSDAYMHCSYMARADKHAVKPALVSLVRKLLDGAIDEVKITAKREITKRPTIVIPMEWSISVHAMHRCYGPSIESLRDRFRLVAFARTSKMDDEARRIFDEVVPVPEGDFKVADLARQVREASPDLIYYPSIGMSAWWTSLAAFRLAPIQAMTLGHPATSGSTAIDYVVCEEDVLTDPALFLERCILTPSRATRYMERLDAKWPETSIREHPDQIIVAVPAMIAKLNAPYLALLKRIRERAKRQVRFAFFPNQVGLGHFQARKALERWLPGAVSVHPRMEYNAYLDLIAACDIHLSPFPFGGTNSNLDSLTIGLPLVALEGPEPHTMTDVAMLCSLGLGELVARTVEEYEDLAVSLIDDDEYRVEMARKVLASPLREQFYAPRVGAAEGAFLRAFEAIYERHEEFRGRPAGEAIHWREFI